MTLNASAKEWKPPATSKTNPDVLLTADFHLPPSNNLRDPLEGDDDWHNQDVPGRDVDGFDPHSAVYVYDEVTGEGVLHENGYEGEGDGNGGGGGPHNFGPPPQHYHYQSQQSYGAHHPPHRGGAPGAAGGNDVDAHLHALHQAVFGPPADANVDENGMPFLPELPGQEDTDWDAALQEFLAAQREIVLEQVEEQRIRESGGAAAAEQRHVSEFPLLPQATDSKSAAAFWAKGPTAIRQSSQPSAPPAAPRVPPSSAGPSSSSYTAAGAVGYGSGTSSRPNMASSSASSVAASSAAPLTINGKHRWPKQTKAQQRQEAVQKQAFEAFANALLHSTSPFMAPLRELCKSSLPHLKLDQRFGKRGAPHTAVSQFVVAPIVVNYRPRHFHELSPGDQMEYHYDLSQVLRRIATVNCIAVSYGPDWKPYAVPFCYLGCRDYKSEVLKLCPNEIPNSRSEAVYEDDIVKDITELVLAIEELRVPLQKWSLVQCMAKRVNLSAMYDAFEALFAPIGNYQIQIRNLHSAPSQFLIKTSQQVLDVLPDKGHTGIVLHGDADLWYELPNAANAFQSGKSCVVVSAAGAAAAGGDAAVAADPAILSAVLSTTPAAATPGGASVAGHAATDQARVPQAATSTPIVGAVQQKQLAAATQQSASGAFQSSGKGSTKNGTTAAASNEMRQDEADDVGGNTTADLVLYGVCAAAVLTTIVVVARLLKTSS